MKLHVARLSAFRGWAARAADTSYASPELMDALALLADYEELVDAARDVAFRGPKCDCEMCEAAFERLQGLVE